ncbi:AAA-like domain-containing protein, partial [Leptolyngbya cf. ectocarpi LEGE 11479]
PNRTLYKPKAILELPAGPISIGSNFYIQREPIETHCYETVMQPGALIRIKAPRQMGKTSLMAKILHHAQAQGYQTVVMSMRQANLSLFENPNRLLSWFCSDVTYRLGQPDQLKEHWDDIFGGNSNSTRYFERYLLSELKSPLVLAIDDADVVFRYPEIATDFLGLLRSWYEKARYGVNNSEIWQRLRLIIVHSTEVYIPLTARQSPFNVGLSIDLPEFTPAQVNELACRYSLIESSHTWKEESPNYISILMEQVGGNPYLIKRTFHYLSQNNLALEQLFNSNAIITNIHQEMLHQKWHTLQQYPRLVQAYKKIVTSPHPIQLDPKLRFELQSLGLIKMDEYGISPSCQLYANYFSNHLSSIN